MSDSGQEYFKKNKKEFLEKKNMTCEIRNA